MTDLYPASRRWFERAQHVIPGGVNSPVRSFQGVGGVPLFFHKAQGPYLWDEDARRYIDYVCSWGAVVLGHRHPAVVDALEQHAALSLGFGAPCALEVELAACIVEDYFPHMDMVRMVNSGTEATMTAIRLARGYTQREGIITCRGSYHGHADCFLHQGGSGLQTLGLGNPSGVPARAIQDTLVADFNDLDSVQRCFEAQPNQVAAVMVEPVMGNLNLILPEPGFLEGLRQLCDAHGALLIFDEVMTGFRVGPGGAQGLYRVQPDLTTLGKIIGGGLPVGAVGGPRSIMSCLAPLGSVYQAGTLSGHPLAMATGLATLRTLRDHAVHAALSASTTHLLAGLRDIAQRSGVPLHTTQAGGMFGVVLAREAITSPRAMRNMDTEPYARFFHASLEAGVYWAPSAFECGFMSWAHDLDVINDTLDRVDTAIQGDVWGRVRG